MMRPWNWPSRRDSSLAKVVMSTSTSTAVTVVPAISAVPVTPSAVPVASASWPKSTSVTRYCTTLSSVVVHVPSMPSAAEPSDELGDEPTSAVVVVTSSRLSRSAASSLIRFTYT
jgi:hypothetical protein